MPILLLSDTELGRQLLVSGVAQYLSAVEIASEILHGHASVALVPYLRAHTDFAEGPLHELHRDVGPARHDFRSYRGSFGPGSLQIVYSPVTRQVYADIDQWNPYADVVGYVGHSVEVVRGWWRRRKAPHA